MSEGRSESERALDKIEAPGAGGGEPPPAPPADILIEAGDAVADLRPVDAQAFQSLDPRHLLLTRVNHFLGAGIAAALLLLPAIGAWLLLPEESSLRLALPLGGWLALSAALFAQALVWPGLVHRRYRYRLDDRGLEIRRGVLWRESVIVPRNRVQHTDVTQGPIERQLGLASLTVFTAGMRHAEVELEGIEAGLAMAMRDALVEAEADDDAV